jgi:hypothetical protein
VGFEERGPIYLLTMKAIMCYVIITKLRTISSNFFLLCDVKYRHKLKTNN